MDQKYVISIEEGKAGLAVFAQEISKELEYRQRLGWSPGPLPDGKETIHQYSEADLTVILLLLQGIAPLHRDKISEYARVAAECIWEIIGQNWLTCDESSPVFESLVLLTRLAEAGGFFVDDKAGNIFFASLRDSVEDFSDAFSLAENSLNRSPEFLAELEHVLRCAGGLYDQEAAIVHSYLEEEENKTKG